MADLRERVGMIPCCSHTGHRTTMDVMRHATKPMIFSHSSPLALWKHKRRIRVEAIRTCAGTGVVIGVNGSGLLLGASDNRPGTVARHIDYVVQQVGIDHVGIGLGYVFDRQELDGYFKAHPQTFPTEGGYACGLGPAARGTRADAGRRLTAGGRARFRRCLAEPKSRPCTELCRCGERPARDVLSVHAAENQRRKRGLQPFDGNANCALSRTPPLGQRCVIVFLRV